MSEKSEFKAYMTFDRHNGPEDGCLLVFARNRNQAKRFGMTVPFGDIDYIDVCAIRKPEFDDLAKTMNLRVIETNLQLPEDRPFFVED